MSKYYPEATLKSASNLHARTSRSRRAERTLGLPPVLFAAMIGTYFLFLGAMAAAFMNPNLVIPFGIPALYIAMAFGMPGLWARIAGRPDGHFQSRAEFRAEGMEIATGHFGSTGASAQLLVLPGLIVGWAIAIAVIAATV